MPSRRDFVSELTVSAAALAGAPFVLRGRHRLFAQTTAEYSARAIKLVEESIVVDQLNQFRFSDFSEKPPRNVTWFTTPNAFTERDFALYRDSGIRVFALGSGPGEYEASIRWFADWNGFLAGYSDWFMRIDDARDFERAKAAGKIGIMLTCQTSDHFRTDDDVPTFFALGQRVSQLTYNATTRTGSGFLADTDAGLTPYGEKIIQRMNAVGMALDLSHCADRTTLDGLAAARKPVLFTHASARALVPGHLRCKTDDMIRRMAASGGVMGIPLLRFLIRGEEPVTPEHVLDHIDYVARLVGIEHVGIGGDLDVLGNPNPVGGPNSLSAQHNFDRYNIHQGPDGKITIAGLDHPKRVYDLTEGLIRRKYNDADIKLILGGNWIRVLTSLWP
jgi:membrane dipeptidase